MRTISEALRERYVSRQSDPMRHAPLRHESMRRWSSVEVPGVPAGIPGTRTPAEQGESMFGIDHPDLRGHESDPAGGDRQGAAGIGMFPVQQRRALGGLAGASEDRAKSIERRGGQLQ